MKSSKLKNERFKSLTLLHSNDLHGDFLAEKIDEKLVGGVSMLDGYLRQCRKEETNCIYAVAGDMFRGSVLDSEYRGLSTIHIMNELAPDVVTIGNHEADYGLAHLLLMEKVARFPIINSNLYLKGAETRLFTSHQILRVDGMKILFIGGVTEEVVAELKKDPLVGSIIDVRDIAGEVTRICRAYANYDIDLTVLLTHIGFEEDKKLAEALSPSLGVDVIIGGHSHTYLEHAEEVNGIIVVQAGMGTDQIGRFDMIIDTEENCLHSYAWMPVPINQETCPLSLRMERIVRNIKKRTDQKYDRVVASFSGELTHPDRYMQTELGGLFADIMKDSANVDVFFIASGSIRNPKLGPVVTYRDFTECYPFDGKVFGVKVTGEQFRRMLKYIYRDDTWAGMHTEFYQLSKGLKVRYSRGSHELLECSLNGTEISDEEILTVGIQEFHYNNLLDFFGIPEEEIARNGTRRILSTSENEMFLEYFAANEQLSADEEIRLEIVD